MSKADDLRAMRERRFGAKPAKGSTRRPGQRAANAIVPSEPGPILGYPNLRESQGLLGRPPRGTKPKRGRPRLEDRHKTLAALKPWAALGMSESTWRRRLAEKAKKNG